MKTYAPDYYSEFTCIADKCRHNCCIGWEIDIDDTSLARYKAITGDFGTRLMSGIDMSDTPHFRLTHDERCPFLNNNNLCDIILHLGEDKLCQICTDHPRYRNFFDSRTEIGIGLCCEAAARLILEYPHKVDIVAISDDNFPEFNSEEENAFFKLRNDIIRILQNRTRSFSLRIDELISIYNINIPKKSPSDWADFCLNLEHMNSEWRLWLQKLKHTTPMPSDFSHDAKWEIALEQLSIYFIYRHLSESIYDGRLEARIMFALVSVHIIQLLCTAQSSAYSSLSVLEDAARLFSCEIEYSDENTEAFLQLI